MFIKLEARKRLKSAGANSYSRDFFNTLFEAIFTDESRRFNITETINIPEVLIYLPSKTVSTKDMLKFKLNNIVIKRDEEHSTANGATGMQGPNFHFKRNSVQSQERFMSGSPPCKISIGHCSLSVTDTYSLIANADVEVPTNESSITLFGADNIMFMLETKIRETRISGTVFRVSDNRKALYKKSYSSREFHIYSKLPHLEMDVNQRSMSILLQIFDLWVVNVPVILHPFLQVSQLEHVKGLTSDKIFQKYNFSEELMQRIMNHKLACYEVHVPSLRVRFMGEDQQVVCFYAEHLALSSVFSFFHEKHTIRISDLALYHEETKAVYLKLIDEFDLKEPLPIHSNSHSRVAISLCFNDPYLLSTVNKLDSSQYEQDSMAFPIDINIQFSQRIYFMLDPTTLLSLQKTFMGRFIGSQIENETELSAQISQGNRIRTFRWDDQLHKSTSNQGMSSQPEKEIFEGLNKPGFSQEDQYILKLSVGIEKGLIIQFMYYGKELYTLYSPKSYVHYYLSVKGCMHVKTKFYQPMLLDSTDHGTTHPALLEPHHEKLASINLIYTSLTDRKAKEKKFSSYLGVIFRNIRICFLKRRVQEAVEYFRKHVLHLFVGQREYKMQTQAQYEALPKYSVMMIEVYLQHTVIAVPRGSLSSQGVLVYVDRIGLWSTGVWGKTFGSMFRSGHFDNQYLAEMKFYDPIEEVEATEIDNIYELLFEPKEQQTHKSQSRRSNSSRRRNSNSHQSLKDGFKIFTTQLFCIFLQDISSKVEYTKSWFEERAALETGKFVFVDINFDVISNFDIEKIIIPIESKLPSNSYGRDR